MSKVLACRGARFVPKVGVEPETGRVVDFSRGWIGSERLPSNCDGFDAASTADVLINGDEEVR